MTATLDAPARTEPGAGTDAAPRRRSAWSRWRVAARLARRQAWRAKGSSALVVALVALPVAGLAGAATFWQSHQPSPEQKVTLELGENQSWIEIVGGADPSRWQSVDEPYSHGADSAEDGSPRNEQGPTPTDPAGALPAGTEVHTVIAYGAAAVETAGGVGWIPTTAGDVWDSSFEGKYVLLEGAAPAGPREMMASPGALARLGADIGDEVRFPDADRTFILAGTMREARDQASVEALYIPASAADVVEGSPRWYIADWQPDLAQLETLNQAGYIVYARDLVLDPPAGARLSGWGDTGMALWSVVLVGSLVALFSGYVVVLLAGAAFSVSARRQQRALAVAASVGASRTDIFRVVVLQGAVLGAAAGLVGACAGVLGAWLLLTLTDRGAPDTFWGNFGFQVPWLLVLPLVGFAVAVGTLAAMLPARAATRGDTLTALRGARRPAALAPGRPAWGLLVLGTGLAATIVGALFVAATFAQPEPDTQSPLFYAALYAVVFGPLLFQIGVLIPSHWILVQLSRPLSKLGLSARLASRDAAAAPSRVVPAFAVIGACVFVASFAVSATAMTAGGNARHHWFQAPEGSLSVYMWQQEPGSEDALIEAALGVAESTNAAATALVSSPMWPVTDAAGVPTEPDAPYFAAARQRWSDCVGDCLQPYDRASGQLFVVEPADLEVVLGSEVSAAARQVLADGGALVMQPDYLTGDDELVVTEWTAQSFTELQRWNGQPSDVPSTVPAEHRIAAFSLDLDRQQPFEILLAPAAARGLGIPLSPAQLIASYDEPLDQASIDKVVADTRDLRVGPTAGVTAMVETGPPPADPWLWLIIGIAGALVVGASAVTLGLARFERRPDDATLTAVGGGVLLRRSVNAWQAAVIVGIGAAIGTVAGYMSMWGLATANVSFFDLADTPWLWLGVLGIGLPVAVTVAAWLVPPRHPDLTRRTAIT